MNWIKRIFQKRTKSCAIQNVISYDLTCVCEDVKKYDCEVFEHGKPNKKMKLCERHIKAECDKGLIVAF